MKKIIKKIKSKSYVIMYDDRNDLSGLLEECIKLYHMPSNIKAHKAKIIQFRITINEILYIFCLDSNYDSKDMNWEIVKNYCEKYSIEFKNQTFTQFIKELRTQFLDCKREIFDKETKDKVINKCNNKCNNCDIKCKFYEINGRRK
jgi:hypothetical protein